MADGTLFGRVRQGPIVVDLFAGGGGASLGISWALGVSPVAAANHCPHAIRVHALNHPDTEHHLCDVLNLRPADAARGRPVDLLWASPDCTHHSRALGGKPREKGRRALAWVVTDWAREVQPRVIAIENVWEFTEWGPLDDEGHPIKARRGEHFREWVSSLEGAGYVVEWRQLCAADYGAPTSRRRLFLVARRDGQPIAWPAPTHHKAGEPRWRAAAECIDWDIPVRSIFDRKRPLAEKTQARIAEGIRRYVLGAADPFLLCITHGGRLEPITEPLRTVTTAHRGERAIVVPAFVRNNTNNAPHPATDPLGTVTTGGRHILTAATLMKAHGNGFDRPGSGVWSAGAPMPTVTTTEQHAVMAATLVETRNGERAGQAPRARDIRAPLGTITATGSQGAVVAAWLDKLHGSARAGQAITDPMPTVTAGGGKGGGHATLCTAFLMRYFGEGGQWAHLAGPMPTVTAREGLALVTTTIGGEEYILTDIGMRMLTPRELARAQGFPDSYQLVGTKGEQIERLGNAVVPQMAEAIVRANLPELCRKTS